MSENYDYLFKLLLVGDSNVGKSCLLMRFTDNLYTESHVSTIGVDFRIKTMEIEGKLVKLQVWDTAGQERFKTITSSYYRGAQGIIIVYDVSSRASFQSVEDWLSKVEEHNNTAEKLVIGNKCDKAEREVDTEEAARFCKEKGLEFIETSARRNENVEAAFKEIVTRIKGTMKEVQPSARQVRAGKRMTKGCACN